MKKLMVACGMFALVGLGFLLGSLNFKQIVDVEFSAPTIADVELLSYTNSELEDKFDEADHLELFLNLHNELIMKHQVLKEKYSTLKETSESLISTRQAFRKLEVRLSFEDGMTLWNLYYDLLDLKDEHKETHGLAYQRLIALKGLYNNEHIELIIQTYIDVIGMLNQREAMIDQAISMMNQSILIYQNYLI